MMKVIKGKVKLGAYAAPKLPYVKLIRRQIKVPALNT